MTDYQENNNGTQEPASSAFPSYTNGYTAAGAAGSSADPGAAQSTAYTAASQAAGYTDPGTAQNTAYTAASQSAGYTAAAQGAGSSYAQPAPQKPKKEKKHGFGLVLACALSALVFAFGGTVAANRLFPAKGSSSSTPTIVESTSTGVNNNVDTTSSLSSVVSATKNSVVEITTESMSTTSGYFGGQYVTEGAGSGVIITADGYIVTNNHVISGAQTINVTTADGTQYSGTLVGTDTTTDIAVIKIDASGLTPAVFGDSDSLQVGDTVIAIGNPLGSLGGTVTDGIVSALNREITVDNQTMSNLIQTNADVNPGNSGGGLFNMNGELVGIVNAKSGTTSASSTTIEGLGFAIPANTVKEIATQLMQNGYVSGRPVLGIKVVEVTDAQTASQYGVSRYGVYIVDVTSGLGADKAGLKSGDYIVSINGTAVEGTADVTSVLNTLKVGDTVTLQIIRDNKTLSVDVTLTENVPATAAKAS